MKKLNKHFPYGTISGHAKAAYEQDGVLFDNAGNELTPEKVKSVKVASAEQDILLESATLFLKNILSGGPMAKEVVYKEVGSNNQNWDSVRTAAAQLGLQKYKKGNSEMWKLTQLN